MTALTALAVPARQTQDADLRPMPWRRMAWVTWRQHRTALTGMAVLLVALAVYLWLAGLQLHHAYAAAIACHPARSFACSELIDNFNGDIRISGERPRSAGSARADRGIRRRAGAGP